MRADNTQLAMISILVRDQDEALRFYTEKLGMEKRVDVTYGPGMRLLTVAPRGQEKPELALAQPAIEFHGEEQVRVLMERNGQQKPRVLVTENCSKTYELFLQRGVKFLREPTKHLHGIEAMFEDPSGNVFALLEASPEMRLLLENRQGGTAA